jgi:predicted enzyme involved in methoxymalonyl-ACP biosynthesis
VFDINKDNLGHIPFTDEFYSTMGLYTARMIQSLKTQHFKVIVLDCDNTLWDGIVGEDGPLGIKITEPFKKLQKFMLEKHNQGFLLTICSKNNENDVLEVFEKIMK